MPIIALALVPALLHWPVLLMPVHIVLLELLIDPACSIVFEAEPECRRHHDAGRRAPRPRSPFAAANLRYAVIQGLGFAAILLLGLWRAARPGAGRHAKPQRRIHCADDSACSC